MRVNKSSPYNSQILLFAMSLNSANIHSYSLTLANSDSGDSESTPLQHSEIALFLPNKLYDFEKQFMKSHLISGMQKHL
jgi:hypothetical protein